VGLVKSCPGGEFPVGAKVAALMGGARPHNQRQLCRIHPCAVKTAKASSALAFVLVWLGPNLRISRKAAPMRGKLAVYNRIRVPEFLARLGIEGVKAAVDRSDEDPTFPDRHGHVSLRASASGGGYAREIGRGKTFSTQGRRDDGAGMSCHR
jgi:hypothetical protein